MQGRDKKYKHEDLVSAANPVARTPITARGQNPRGISPNVQLSHTPGSECTCPNRAYRDSWLAFDSEPSTSINESKTSTTPGLNARYVPTPESSMDDHTNSGHNAVTSDSPTSRPSTSITGTRTSNCSHPNFEAWFNKNENANKNSQCNQHSNSAGFSNPSTSVTGATAANPYSQHAGARPKYW